MANETVDTAISGRDEERQAAAAYLMDRAAQYMPNSPCVTALMTAAIAIMNGEHAAAWSHGELDGLKVRVRRARKTGP